MLHTKRKEDNGEEDHNDTIFRELQVQLAKMGSLATIVKNKTKND